MTEFNDLGLTSKSSGGGCGDACMCVNDNFPAETTATASAVTEEYLVTGMTCSHCVSSVTEELSELDGVESVTVQLDAEGASRVSVASTARLDPAAVRAAIDEAGYALVES